MSRSVLLQLTRDSIQEVLQAQRTINKQALLHEHPLLGEKIPTKINIYLENELRGSASSLDASKTLLESIIENAKLCAFQDSNFTPISTSEYISCEIELQLTTPEGIMSERDKALLPILE